ncbi:MAG: antitermination protein NusG [Planctomycetes bacterium]|nr:antitermination protein NusG [Planctomycetota bacterium]
MPILAPETSLFPHDLLDRPLATGQSWWVLYTLSRQEKLLMRRLEARGVAFFCPIVARRHRSPGGRVRETQLPLFSNYVFICGDEDARRTALTTNCVSRTIQPDHAELFLAELRQIRRLIATGAPLTPECRIVAGQRVRVRNGAFRGFEGIVVRREAETRLLVAVNFLQQGASVLLDDCQLEVLG